MIKITIISDTHGDYYLLDLKPADILIICGDIGIWNQVDLWRFNRWLEKQPFEYKVCCAGNHDKFLYECGMKSIQQQLSSAIYLENSGCEILGLKLWGSPITPTFLNWFFMCERSEIKKYWDQISVFYNDIIITHGPPFGILDYAVFSKEHVGCEALLKRVNFIRPRYHIFGHIHGSYGIYKTEHTTFINASLMNEAYQLVNKPVTIEID